MKRSSSKSVSLAASLEVMDGPLVFLHVEVAHASFLKASLFHIGLQALSERFNSFIDHPQLFLSCSLA